MVRVMRRGFMVAGLCALSSLTSCQTPARASAASAPPPAAVDPDASPAERVGALLAHAEQAYAAGDDGAAIASAEAGLAEALGHGPDLAAQATALQVVRLRALVRGGPPAAALSALDRLPAAAVPEAELRGMKAIVLDRKGDHEGAVVAFARWRAALRSGTPEALYAEQRFEVLAAELPDARLRKLARSLEEGDAAACLAARAGDAVPAGRSSWVGGCRASPVKVAVLLPRTGRYAALADTHLAAVSAAVTVLARRSSRPLMVLWRDSASSPDRARAAAKALVEAGAQVIVGPVGRESVRATIDGVADRVPVVVPGEGPLGVAPDLERRVAALVEHAREQGTTRLVVLAPDTRYGRRASAGVVAALERHGSKPLKIITYSPDTTSFAKVLDPVLPDLRKGAALLCPDRLTRVELVVRQLRRAGVDPASTTLILTTGEGLGPSSMAAAARALEGVWIAPVAAPSAATREFAVTYAAREGQEPDDQALLVWHALARAVAGGSGGRRPPVLVRVKGGRLVEKSRTSSP
jgi:ABC-type branched-subunit amino acid transport system substrate-binding protein